MIKPKKSLHFFNFAFGCGALRLPGFLLLFGFSLLLCKSAFPQVTASQPARLAFESLLLDGSVAGDRIIVVGERGHILLSNDDGLQWTQVHSPVSVLLTASHMHGAHLGFAVGHDGVILRTENGGLSWEIVHYAPEEERPLLDVWFADDKRGFAVGAFGYFLYTEDQGDSWHHETIGEADYHLNVIASSADSKVYIGAETGIAYRSNNAGTDWQELTPPYSGSWFGALALNNDTVFLCGLRGSLYRSRDAGTTWQQINTGTTATMTGMTISPNGDIFVSGLDGVLLTSRDRGESFTLTQFTDRMGISRVMPLVDGGVVLLGEFGVRRLEKFELQKY